MQDPRRDTNRATTSLGENGWIAFMLRHPWPVLLLCLTLILLAAAGIPRLSFTTDSRIFFSKDNPQLAALEELENTFSRDDNILFVLAPKDNNVFSRATLAAIAWLTDQSWLLPYATRVNSLTNFQHTRAVGDDIVVSDLVPQPADLTAKDLAAIRRIALAEPLLVNHIIAPDGSVTGIDVLITRPGRSPEETAEVVGAARRLASRFTARYPDITIHLTGGVVIDQAFGEASRRDLQTLVPGMYLVLLGLLACILRSLAATLATLAVILGAMLTAMGGAGWAGLVLSPPTANAPTIILTLAVADSVHIAIAMHRYLAEGAGKRQAIAKAVRANLTPVLITSVTTAVGFLSMLFSDAPPFRELGCLVAAGVLAALAYSLTLLPCLLAILPARSRPAIALSRSQALLRDRLANWIIARHRLLFWGILVVTLATVAGMGRIELDDDFVKYFDRSFPFRQATDFAEERLTGFNVIEYKLPAPGPGMVNDPAYLEQVERFAAWYRQQPKVAHVFAISDIYKQLNKSFHANDPAWYRLPETRELAAQYLLLYEMSLPFGHDLNNVINVDKSASRMVVRVRRMSSREIRATDAQARAWLKANAPGLFTYGTGLSIVFAHLSKRNIDSMLSASFGALAIISLLLAAIFRSIRYGLVSLAPNLLPALAAFGLWGYFVGTVDLVISVIAAVTLGIVVDDTIHFLHRYLEARRTGHDAATAIRLAFGAVGAALWVTTVVLTAGFAVLTLSGFSLNAHMGLMCGLTIVIALAMDFFFLPPLLLLVDR